MAVVPPTENPMLEAALTYARYGWKIFPCKANKSPATPHGFKDATTDPEQIRAWWQQYPMAPIGVACGASGITVADYDPRNDPDKTGALIYAELTDGVQTRQARTGRGGTHRYFKTPPGVALPPKHGTLGAGVDIQADGTYVVVPPSISDAGPYQWTNQASVAPMPQQLIEAVQQVAEQVASAPVVEGMIPEGMRNDTLFRNACAMRRRGMAPTAIERALLAENQERCNPPLPDDQVRTTIGSALRYKPEEVSLTPPIGGKPVAVLLARDSVKVSMIGAEGAEASFAFEQMERTSKNLEAVLTVVVAGQDDRCRRRINMLSASAQRDMRVELDNIFGKPFGWARALNKAFELAEDTFLKQKRSIALPDIPVSIRGLDVISTLLPSDGITMLYGLGGVNKSYLALAMAIASATGQPFAEMYPASPGNVLYVDYEDNESVFRDRASRLWDGPLPPNIHYYEAGGVPLKDQWEALQAVCNEEAIHWLIIDSVGPAVAGDLKDATGSLTLTNTLARLKLPGLLIHHLSKGSDGSSAYGSVYFGNAVRRAWLAEALEGGDPDDIQVQLKCTKVNEGRKPSPQYLRVVFDGDREGAVRILSRQPTATEASPHRQLREALSRGARTLADLSIEMGMTPYIVKKNLTSSDEFVQSTEPSGGGRPRELWGLRFTPPVAVEEPEGLPF